MRTTSPRQPKQGRTPRPAAGSLTTELLVLPDGRILVHDLTPGFAALLNELKPSDEAIKLRVEQTRTGPAPPTPSHELRPGT